MKIEKMTSEAIQQGQQLDQVGMKGQRQLHPKQAMPGVEPDHQSILKPLFVSDHLPGKHKELQPNQ